MNNNHEVIISGTHMDLTDVLKQTVRTKLERLFHSSNQIVRIRVDLSFNHRKDSKEDFAAKGHVALNNANANLVDEDAIDAIDATLDKMIDKHGKKVLKAQYTAKGIIEYPGSDLIASEDSEDLYKSIDKMIDKLERLLHERSDINKTKRNHPHDIDIPSNIPKAKS